MLCAGPAGHCPGGLLSQECMQLSPGTVTLQQAQLGNSSWAAATTPHLHSPAVLNQVMHNLVQDLLEKGRANPEVLDGLRGQVRQLRHLAHILLEALHLVSPAGRQGRGQHKRINQTAAWGTCSSPSLRAGLSLAGYQAVLVLLWLSWVYLLNYSLLC